MANSTAGETVLTRLVRVLESFDRGSAALTMSQVARRAGLPVATGHRMVSALVQEGLLERGPDGLLRVGTRLWEFSARSPRVLGLREAAMPFLEDVHAMTRQHVQLSVLHEQETLFIERMSAPRAVENLSQIGRRLPINVSASGRVVLAFRSAAEQEAVLTRPMPAFTHRSTTDPAQLRRELAEIRRVGHLVAAGQVHLHATGIAAPIFGPGREAVAALAVVVPSADGLAQQHVAAVQTAARGISRALGAQLSSGAAISGSSHWVETNLE